MCRAQRGAAHKATSSAALPEYADATDANLRRLGHGLDRDQPHPELRHIQSAGEVHGVDDMSDLEDEGETVACMFAIGQRRLAHAKQRDAARQKLGMPGWIVALRQVDVDAKGSGVIEAAYILEIEKDSVRCRPPCGPGCLQARGYFTLDRSVERN